VEEASVMFKSLERSSVRMNSVFAKCRALGREGCASPRGAGGSGVAVAVRDLCGRGPFRAKSGGDGSGPVTDGCPCPGGRGRRHAAELPTYAGRFCGDGPGAHQQWFLTFRSVAGSGAHVCSEDRMYAADPPAAGGDSGCAFGVRVRLQHQRDGARRAGGTGASARGHKSAARGAVSIHLS
jgi:hypothetical protein